jgi:hypothetical protein
MHEWQLRIAHTEYLEDLVELARVYLATWSPENLGRVPEECRPTRVKGVDDLFFWRDRLVGVYCGGGVKDDSDSLIRDLLAFFAAAGDRAYTLRESFDPLRTMPPLFSDNSIPRLFTSAQTGATSD